MSQLSTGFDYTACQLNNRSSSACSNVENIEVNLTSLASTVEAVHPPTKRIRTSKIPVLAPIKTTQSFSFHYLARRDKLILRVIEHIRCTKNQPHTFADLLIALVNQYPLSRSTNPSSVLSSRLSSFFKRPWTLEFPCPLDRIIVSTAPRQVYAYFLRDTPRLPYSFASSLAAQATPTTLINLKNPVKPSSISQRSCKSTTKLQCRSSVTTTSYPSPSLMNTSRNCDTASSSPELNLSPCIDLQLNPTQIPLSHSPCQYYQHQYAATINDPEYDELQFSYLAHRCRSLTQHPLSAIPFPDAPSTLVCDLFSNGQTFKSSEFDGFPYEASRKSHQTELWSIQQVPRDDYLTDSSSSSAYNILYSSPVLPSPESLPLEELDLLMSDY